MYLHGQDSLSELEEEIAMRGNKLDEHPRIAEPNRVASACWQKAVSVLHFMGTVKYIHGYMYSTCR